ncbi:MetQ/NlpA family ABC transporter substrate-binding protein [Ruania halotolerans]|uniref:MetQ/NlpA family ABC transporter substrate-binding protein n=1 Tax=Ruania halotolerans TaxID=2897773 RepID=UPI001E620429|nr:MetQ/NlpA family ABC transporter substrate-binding protein [Ruania halotolerans]UFU05534.1 MetQ/NlpA family ABC transporter substrate-binding protein [Ruania halotolerans]
MSTLSRRHLGATALAATAALTLAACGGADAADGAASGSEDDPIRIGVVNSAEPQWEVFEAAAADEGITVEMVNFSDYQLPNQGLTDGDLDLNQFQHLQFLAKYNVNTDSDLTPIGATAVYPLSLFSLEHANVDEIPEGSEIAIPNDETNQARALLVLQEAGLLTLDGGGSAFSTPADVIAAESRVSVTPVDAAQTALALQDVAASIINNDFVADAGLVAEDAIFSDDPASDAAAPYINIWVSSADEAENETFAQLVELYHTPEVEEAAFESSGESAVFVDNPADELQEILAQIESDFSE